MFSNLFGRRANGRAAGPPARAARLWSNAEIARLAPLVVGDVINVSAWKDEDKEGRRYRDYFTNASTFATSNYAGWRGDEGDTDHVIDLEAPLPADLRGRFDCAFNHTTLEHVFEFARGFATLCDLSRDAVLLVVPFLQHLHGPEDGDFWRPSPYAIRRLFARNGLGVLYESAGPRGEGVRYMTYFASRRPESWTNRLPRPEHDAEAVLREPVQRPA